jgi:hypothetical protein
MRGQLPNLGLFFIKNEFRLNLISIFEQNSTIKRAMINVTSG